MDLIDYLTTGAAVAAGAATFAQGQSIGDFIPNGLIPQIPLSAPRTISIAVTNVPAVQAAAVADSKNQGGGSVTGKPGVANPSSGNQTVALTLDIYAAPNVNGWPQTLSYQLLARQSEQQTFLGYHVLEYGIAIGQLDVDCMVYIGATGPSALDPFFNLLYSTKRTTPLSSENPSRVLYTDSFKARSFVITVRSVTMREDRDNLNMARLQINAGILYDYSMPSAGSSAVPSSAVTLAQQQAAVLTAASSLTSVGFP